MPIEYDNHIFYPKSIFRTTIPFHQKVEKSTILLHLYTLDNTNRSKKCPCGYINNAKRRKNITLTWSSIKNAMMYLNGSHISLNRC